MIDQSSGEVIRYEFSKSGPMEGPDGVAGFVWRATAVALAGSAMSRARPENRIILSHGEILPVFDGHVARFIATKNDTTMKIEIPIPANKFQQYGLLDKLRSLLSS